jgi:hypothetical protein
MEYREKIILFEEYKSLFLADKLSIEKELYFNRDDAAFISGWSDRFSRLIWGSLEYHISDPLRTIFGFARTLQPFCYAADISVASWSNDYGYLFYNNRCEFCRWADDHVKCGHAKSDASIIGKAADSINVKIYDILNGDFYKSLLGYIENKDNYKDCNYKDFMNSYEK